MTLCKPKITLALSTIFISGCSTVSLISSNSYTLYGTYVDYNCQPIASTKVSIDNNIRRGAYLTSGISRSSTDTTNEEGHFELTAYEGERSFVKTNDLYYKLNTVDLEQLNNKTTELQRVYFYKKRTHYDYDVFSENRGWLHTTPAYKDQNLVGNYSKKRATGILAITRNNVILISNKENEDKTGWEILIQAKNGYIVREQGKDFNGDIPENGYTSELKIIAPYTMFNQWKQHKYFVKYENGAYYGVFSIDIKLNSKFVSTDIGKQNLIYFKAWASTQEISSRTRKSTNRALVGSYDRNKTPLAERASIKEPYIPLKTCGNRPDFHNDFFLKHPAESKFEKRQKIKAEERRKKWEETVKEEKDRRESNE